MLLASSPYRPTSAYHIAGLTNVVADMLSRRYDPSKSDWQLPDQLHGVDRTALPTRSEEYYIVDSCIRDSGIKR